MRAHSGASAGGRWESMRETRLAEAGSVTSSRVPAPVGGLRRAEDAAPGRGLDEEAGLVLGVGPPEEDGPAHARRAGDLVVPPAARDERAAGRRGGGRVCRGDEREERPRGGARRRPRRHECPAGTQIFSLTKTVDEPGVEEARAPLVLEDPERLLARDGRL